MKDTFQIGEMARKIGVQPESIRYYERIGLLPKARRGTGGYRLFSRDDLGRVELIKKMQALGFHSTKSAACLNSSLRTGTRANTFGMDSARNSKP
jgi:DNA-binding transcriptional MerR regulator